MTMISSHKLSLRIEELPVICNFAISNFSRDRADFTNFSPRFNLDYENEFKTYVTTANNVLRLQSEMIEQKRITTRIYATADGLVDSLNRLKLYINFPGEKPPITSADFGIDGLRRSITTKDIEGVLKFLGLININLAKYKDQLIPQGLTDDLILRFTDAQVSVAADKQRQYEMIAYRKSIVQNNNAVFMILYDRLREVLAVGKALYKITDPAKCNEYALSNLKKRVHRISNPVVPGTTIIPGE